MQENRKEVVLVGIETHICVSQTALELKDHGYNVVVLADAVSSSSPQERVLALQRMSSSGITINSVEGWVFETLESAEHPSFRQVSSLLKQTANTRTQTVQALL
ncbi:uncharacterized protein TRUGW13939_09294 [Talaromyces rugulosus]|uniref:Isochorismatase-like domain-containing protein n=1 Tax=Talaromyces rugulosus TaxID=121627 RepID=A0A7H8R7L0_TALRU|nr:uncharacterized protein TRUGW13939_09294 [Talaromyces rugulosus]QKX62137.1 hypothetical protein TRUGW13939_09294 [Talaromyces rugulosus]